MVLYLGLKEVVAHRSGLMDTNYTNDKQYENKALSWVLLVKANILGHLFLVIPLHSVKIRVPKFKYKRYLNFLHPLYMLNFQQIIMYLFKCKKYLHFAVFTLQYTDSCKQ